MYDTTNVLDGTTKERVGKKMDFLYFFYFPILVYLLATAIHLIRLLTFCLQKGK